MVNRLWDSLTLLNQSVMIQMPIKKCAQRQTLRTDFLAEHVCLIQKLTLLSPEKDKQGLRTFRHHECFETPGVHPACLCLGTELMMIFHP
jgi:hypothetical protein